VKGSIWSCIHGDVPSWNAFMRVSSSTVLPHSIWQTTAGREQAQLQGNSVTRASSTILPHSIWQTTAGREQAQLQGNSLTRGSSTVLPHSLANDSWKGTGAAPRAASQEAAAQSSHTAFGKRQLEGNRHSSKGTASQEPAAQSSHTAFGKRQLEGNRRSSKGTASQEAAAQSSHTAFGKRQLEGNRHSSKGTASQEPAAQSSHTAFGKRQLEGNRRSSKGTASQEPAAQSSHTAFGKRQLEGNRRTNRCNTYMCASRLTFPLHDARCVRRSAVQVQFSLARSGQHFDSAYKSALELLPVCRQPGPMQDWLATLAFAGSRLKPLSLKKGG
jgi:hypothetical protein